MITRRTGRDHHDPGPYPGSFRHRFNEWCWVLGFWAAILVTLYLSAYFQDNRLAEVTIEPATEEPCPYGPPSHCYRAAAGWAPWEPQEAQSPNTH